MSNSGEHSVQVGQGSLRTRIFYRVIGDGPRTLLFLHGWGGSGSGAFWNPLLQHLDPTGLRLVLLDLRGHGRSEPTREGFTTEQFALDVFELADQLGATDFAVVAYSMSGRWAQWMACTQPERVHGQILIAPVPTVALPLTDEILDDWIHKTRIRATMDVFLGQFTKDPLSPELVDSYFTAVQSTPEHSLRESFRMCCHPGFTDRLATTRAATLVIGGMHDPILTPDFLRQEVVGRIPRARLALLDCGHEIPLERPHETATLIEAFVAGLGS